MRCAFLHNSLKFMTLRITTVKSSDEPEEIWLQKSDYMIITVDVCLV